MVNSINFNKFKFIRQNGDFCIPASIENVMKYHNVDVDQYQIVGMWRQNHTMRSIDIQEIKTMLRKSRFRNNFEFILGAGTGVSFSHDVDHANRQAVVDYAKTCCDDGNPLIVVLGRHQVPSAHMLVVIGYNQNCLLFFDPANNCACSVCICYIPYNFLINQQFFHDNLTTLLIKPR